MEIMFRCFDHLTNIKSFTYLYLLSLQCFTIAYILLVILN